MLPCALCSQNVSEGFHHPDELSFCCVGCKTVFQILSSQNIQEHFKEHPLFQEALRSGLISNPALQQQLHDKEIPETEFQKIHLEIEKMWCPSCAEVISLLLLREKGIRFCRVDYATDLAVIEFAPCLISKECIFSLIERFGYFPRSLTSLAVKKEKSHLWKRFAVAAFCGVNLMMLAYPLYCMRGGGRFEGYGVIIGWLSFFLALPILFYSASPIWRRFWLSLKTACFGMETLVLLATTTAFFYSIFHLLRSDWRHLYFDSMGMIIVFVLLGKILERRAKFSTKETLLQLARSLPKRGRKCFPNGEHLFLPLKEIREGDILLVFPGEKIVLDGIIIEGEGSCDESVMTGEAIPIQKKIGSSIIGGTIVKQGTLRFQVTKTEEQTVLSSLMKQIEGDLLRKRFFFRPLDKWIRFFVPAVLLISFLTLLLSGGDLLRGLAVLLISCPCAIGIAAPLGEALLIGRFASLGMLVRNFSILPLLAETPFFVFDKTGTLTEGIFTVQSGLDAIHEKERAILKGLASHSMHPVSAAINENISESPIPLQDLQEIAGKGMIGKIDGREYLLGSQRFLQEKGIEVPGVERKALQSIAYFAGSEVFPICLGDRLRTSLPNIDGMILSGDTSDTVSEVAEKCQFQMWQGGCDPFEKKEVIQKLKEKGRVIAMVGDGMNDALALTAADIAISVRSASDLSIQVSDLFLTADSLHLLPELCLLAKKGRRVIFQNLFWAFFYNAIGIGLAACGVLSPIFAAVGMVVSSLLVTFNSLRLMNYRQHEVRFEGGPGSSLSEKEKRWSSVRSS